MNLKSLNIIKYFITLIFIIFSINLMITGNKTLNKFMLSSKNYLSLLQKNKSIKNDGLTQKNVKKYSSHIVEKNLLKKDEVSKEILKETIIVVKKNDTFSKIIDNFFITKQQKNEIINKINQEYNLKNLKIGQKIFFYENSKKNFLKIILPINFNTDIVGEINPNDTSVKKNVINVTKEIRSKLLTINSSFYQDGIKSEVPISVLIDAIKLYSFDIDFQRDIQKNTSFEVSYEIIFSNNKRNSAYGNIVYANLVIQNKNLEYFLFKTNEGYEEYFDGEGKNVKKALLKTPLDGAKLSSAYGIRKHPISGYNKMHKGVDFAAPKGTPIYSGGNGVIEYIGNNGGYGKYIRIRHNNEYKTAYAHLSAFKKGMQKGKRVNQGDIIGFVGSTGKSTGPHLHYEIIFQNKQINPLKMKLPSGKILKGNELEKFKKQSKEIYAKHLFSLYE